ncbi:MAG: 16S rRNA processing protein RimM [Pelagibacterales bacterium]|nr:16S rRNA processing protein RimM [Pelagibacterales bacterium]
MDKKILVGKVTSVFGIKGEVKVISYCENPTQIEKYDLFDSKGNQIKLKISNKNKTIVGSNALGDSILIAAIQGVTDRNAAENLRGEELFANRKDFKEVKNDEFYYVDLIGLDVIDDNLQKLGKVTNVSDFGGGGMLEIEFLKADSKNNLEKVENFPFKNETFPEINLKENFIKIKIPEILK